MRLASDRVSRRIQSQVESMTYGDMATYITRTASTPDNFGELTYTETSRQIACSFTDTASKEDWRDYADVQEIDAEIRFSAVTPSKGDAITITQRFGESMYTDRRYHIIGIKDRGTFGYVCALKAVDL